MGTAHSKHVQHGKYIKTSVKNIKERDHLEDLGASGKITLTWILENGETGVTTVILPRKSTVGRLFRNELSSPVEDGAFLASWTINSLSQRSSSLIGYNGFLHGNVRGAWTEFLRPVKEFPVSNFGPRPTTATTTSIAFLFRSVDRASRYNLRK
jgi:hypothetical protein